MRIRQFIGPLSAALIGVLCAPLSTLAQCALCKAAVEGSADAASASGQLDAAILVLLIPPVAMFIGLFVVVYRLRNKHEERPERPKSVSGLPPGIWDSM